jgi:hypothetical protein
MSPELRHRVLDKVRDREVIRPELPGMRDIQRPFLRGARFAAWPLGPYFAQLSD